MEKNVSITLDQARELYKCGFKEIAMQAYCKKELELPSVDEVSKYYENNPYIFGKILKDSNENFNLAYLAEFFNNGWKKTTENTGYFLNTVDYLNYMDNVTISSHASVVYPGVVYFKERSDIFKAIRILKNKEFVNETSKFLQSCKIAQIINMCK